MAAVGATRFGSYGDRHRVRRRQADKQPDSDNACEVPAQLSRNEHQISTQDTPKGGEWASSFASVRDAKFLGILLFCCLRSSFKALDGLGPRFFAIEFALYDGSSNYLERYVFCFASKAGFQIVNIGLCNFLAAVVMGAEDLERQLDSVDGARIHRTYYVLEIPKNTREMTSMRGPKSIGGGLSKSSIANRASPRRQRMAHSARVREQRVSARRRCLFRHAHRARASGCWQ